MNQYTLHALQGTGDQFHCLVGRGAAATGHWKPGIRYSFQCFKLRLGYCDRLAAKTDDLHHARRGHDARTIPRIVYGKDVAGNQRL